MTTDFPNKYRDLGLKIAYHRKRAGLTQSELAEAAKLSTHFLAQVEAPGIITGVSLESLFRIAAVLKIPPSKLLEED